MDGSPSRASTWWRLPVSGVVAPEVAEAVVSAMRRVAVMRAAEAAEYHPDYPSRWDTEKLVKSIRSIYSPLASRIAPNGYVPYALVGLSLFFYSLPFSFHFPPFSPPSHSIRAPCKYCVCDKSFLRQARITYFILVTFLIYLDILLCMC